MPHALLPMEKTKTQLYNINMRRSSVGFLIPYSHFLNRLAILSQAPLLSYAFYQMQCQIWVRGHDPWQPHPHFQFLLDDLLNVLEVLASRHWDGRPLRMLHGLVEELLVPRRQGGLPGHQNEHAGERLRHDPGNLRHAGKVDVIRPWKEQKMAALESWMTRSREERGALQSSDQDECQSHICRRIPFLCSGCKACPGRRWWRPLLGDVHCRTLTERNQSSSLSLRTRRTLQENAMNDLPNACCISSASHVTWQL